MRKNNSYNENKSKKALLIIIGLLVICFAARALAVKISESNREKKEEFEEGNPEEENVADTIKPVIQITPPTDDETEEKTSAEETEMKINTEDEFYISEISDELFEKMKSYVK